jgi:PLP dependent protein
MDIAGRWQQLQESVARAAESADRSPQAIRIVGVTKYVTADIARQLIAAGCHDLGESRPQGLWEKAAALSEVEGVRWHMIGHLQRNKLRRTLPLVTWIHSVDSARLLESLQQESAQLALRPRLLIEINLTQDAEKTGLAPDAAEELLLRQADLPDVELVGLMGMASRGGDLELAAQEFAALRRLRDRFEQRLGRSLPELSMGMSQDFEVAIAHGATMIRIGSLLTDPD